MIRSMTGFGTAAKEVDGARYVIEVRSLNSKYFKAVTRVPEELQGLEPELESAVASRLNRGSITVTVRFSDTSADAAAQINTNALQRYFDQLLDVPGVDHDTARIDVGALIALPGVVMSGTGEQMLERAKPVLASLTQEACDKVLAMRSREGRGLHELLHTYRRQVAERLAVIAERAPKVVELYQERLRDRITVLLAENATAVSDDDLLREVAVYAERADIAEEVTRLQAHLEHFAEIIDADDGEPAGRTLDFLGQEMLREANTIAAKCLDAQISRLIVEVKGAIDRIKEQVQNVE